MRIFLNDCHIRKACAIAIWKECSLVNISTHYREWNTSLWRRCPNSFLFFYQFLIQSEMFWFQWMVMPLSLVPLANYNVLGSHLYLHYQIVAECKRLPSYSNNKDSSPDTVVNTACLILNKTKLLGSPYSKNGGGDKLVLINSFASFCAFLL